MDVRSEIIVALKTIIKDLTDEKIIPQLEHPVDEEHGDYSSNIALVASKILKKNPFELAQEIAEKLNSRKLKLANIDEIEAVKPGFINFWFSKDYLTIMIMRIIIDKDAYGNQEKLKNQKIMVEFTDPNPFKEFHIGHLYSNIVGESICRLLEANGAIVKRANYQGDVGMHVAKAIYGLLISKFKIQNSKMDRESLTNKVKLLGEAYILGAKVYEEDEKAKREIEELNKKIYDKEQAITALYEKGRQWSLEYFEQIYKRLGTKFDYYYFESEVGRYGVELIKEYLKKGVFEESQGAVIFPGEKYNLHNRVFINSQGFPTYEAKELGLAPTKYKDFKYDQSIVVTGNEIIEYFKVLLAVLKQIYPDLAVKTKHLAHGIVRLREGKMSSRTGNVLTGEWLLDEAKHRIITKYEEMDQDTAEKVAIGAVKYALLKSGVGRDIEFNFDESISLEGNSGPYLQYAYARTQSVLAKVKTSFTRPPLVKLEPEETSLLRALSRFPEVVEEAAEKFAPNLLCNYLFDLAQKFNLFYQKHPILESEQREFRLALTMAVGQIIKNGLYLLGISAPERM